MDAVVCVSDAQARRARRALIPERKLTVIRNAVPAGEVDYVAGNKQGLPFGTYRGLVTAYLPANAFDVTSIASSTTS